ncbi:MAG: hypothetical protein ACRDJX_03055 [Solirubrobacteraceae bacterium]
MATDAGDRRKERVETYRAEAIALFTANQEARGSAGRIGLLILTVIGVAVATGINAHSDLVAMALLPLTLMLLSYMFQLYTDVAVTGAARSVLEQLLRTELGGPALIYEFAVSPLRTNKPFNVSTRALNVATGLVVFAVAGAGLYVALEGQVWYVELAFAVGTAVSAVSAVLSYCDMLRAGSEARKGIEQRLRDAGAPLPPTDKHGGQA